MTREIYDKIKGHAVTQSAAEPQDARAKHAVYRIENECFGWDKSFNSEQAYWIILSALAQSDAEPVAWPWRFKGLIEAADESAWVIEFSSPVCGTKSWYFLGDDPGEFMTTAAEKALRFARKQDAEQFITRQGWTDASAQEIRSRAADRSGE